MIQTEDKQISLTDPDSRSMATSGRGSRIVGYNVQSAVDTKHHLIVAHEVINVKSDRSELSRMAASAFTPPGPEADVPPLGIALKIAYAAVQSGGTSKKAKCESEMKICRLLVLALSAWLLAAVTFTIDTHAQAQGNPKFEIGIAAYQANDLPLAYKSFLAAAKEGHADSQFNVALMYERGIGIVKDEKEAVVWYGKAASQGSALAQFNLGVLYENGRGTEIDFAKANELYRRASVQGDALAIGNLGMLYVRGQGVKENKIAGAALLLMSATLDRSPENHAKQNLSGTPGLNSEMVVAARALSEKLGSTKNLLVPLDEYLTGSENSTKKDSRPPY